MSYSEEQKIKDATIDVLMENNICGRSKLRRWCGRDGNNYLYHKVLLKLKQKYDIEGL